MSDKEPKYKYKKCPTIFVRPNSRIHDILQVMAVTGEIGTSTLAIFGNNKLEHKYNQVVRLMLKEATYKSVNGEFLYRGVAFTRRGNGEEKTIRINLDARPLFTVTRGGWNIWQRDTLDSRRSDKRHIIRTIYTSDWCAACLGACVEFSLEHIPRLYETSTYMKNSGYEISNFKRGAGDEVGNPRKVTQTLFYNSKEIKRCDSIASDSSKGSRAIGCLVKPDELAVCFSLPTGTMRWSPTSENNFETYLRRTFGPLNFGINGTFGKQIKAICMAKSFEEAERTVFSFKSDETEKKKNRETGTPFTSLYNEIYVIPKSFDGAKQLKLIALPNLDERIFRKYIVDKELVEQKSKGTFECDSYDRENKEAVFFFWTGNIAKLRKNAEILATSKEWTGDKPPFLTIVCFPWQVEYIKKTIGDSQYYEIYPTDFEATYRDLCEVKI